MKHPKDELPMRLEASGVSFQGQDRGDINVARVRFDEDYEAIELSPSGQMGELMNHLEAKLKG